jgi:radical SAM family uncharacterized protein/radical SAM-linked protein
MPDERRRIGREEILDAVEKPGRYLGGEWNAIRKDPDLVRVRAALAFPDAYEIGMSYIGQKILYSLINERPEWAAERVFAPWPDYEARLRETGLPLSSLENGMPLSEFDVLGFSLLYELNYSNILTMLDLGGVPLLAKDRTAAHPLVLAGGPAAFNPEPVADIFDLILLGDGEEAVPELFERLAVLKTRNASRDLRLKDLASLQGVYVPSLYETDRAAGSPLLRVRPVSSAPAPVRKRVLRAFARSPFPSAIVVPNIRAVFDRVAVEVARGCPQKCRFCQAVNIYAPFRVKDPSFVADRVFRSLRATGYDDASFFSLSVSDYPYLEATVKAVMAGLEEKRVALSLSSLRPKGLSGEIAQAIAQVRKTGFTLVPEAGSERLRRVINKPVTDQELITAAANAFHQGWKLLKLYFMVGLPTETEEDLAAILRLVGRLLEAGRDALGSPPHIHLSLSSFIPKPHTPFQWSAMNDAKTLDDKRAFVRRGLQRFKSVEVKDHPVDTSVLEAIFSRGDRRLGAVLVDAWRRGARFDSWHEYFKPSAWSEAFAAQSLDGGDFLGPLNPDADLPWDIVDTGVRKSFLRSEMEKALRGETTPSCLETTCGMCRGCDFSADLERTFARDVESRVLPRFIVGRRTEGVIRYQLEYDKAGPARFISHNDLLNVLHRTFRRAGVEVEFSGGFHPKMLMSFAPALPLGAIGRNEPLEFKSRYEMAEEEALDALNSRTPAGIRFNRLVKLEPDAPSLTNRIEGFVFGLDLTASPVRNALEAIRREEGSVGPLAEIARRRVEDYPRDPGIEDIRVGENGLRLILRLRFDPRRPVRPQDIIERLFGITASAYALTRETLLLKN